MSAQRQAILVTGGAGYIGAHTCKSLADAGFHPIAFDNLSVGHREFVRWGPLIEADIRDTAAVTEACRTHRVFAAIHFAASALVGESVKDPGKYYRNNVAGTLSLVDGVLAADVNTIVMSSSCAIYGVPEKQPIKEETVPNPINPYGFSKLMAEQILSDYEKAHGLRWSALRYFNACGADADADIGEARAVETHLIPRALMWIQGYIESFSVFGTDYPTADGTAIRDYIHVSDLADAHVAALRRLQADESVGVLNLGTGRGYSVLQVLKEIERVTGVALRVNFEGRRAGDPPALIADPQQARTRLRFSPSRSDLETIIQSAWAWHQKAHPRDQSRALSAVVKSNS